MEENKNETVIEKEQESQKTFTEEQVLTLIAQDREKTKKELRKELSKEYGITKCQVLVSEDEKTCPSCASMEGAIFPIDSTPPVPFHPNCRCCMIPVVDI